MQTHNDLAYGPHARNRLDLYLPDTPAENRPLIVCIHGGGWTGLDKQSWAWEAQRFATAGFAAASLNYRLTPDHPFPAAVDDVQRAVRWLRHRAADYGLDPARLGATGDSAGGHLASFLGLTDTRRPAADELAAYSSRVACVVDVYGPVDLLAMLRSASAPIIERFLAAPPSVESVATYLAASPAAAIRPPVPPFLILHGTRDTGETPGDVPIGISEAFARQLHAAGGNVEFVRIEDGVHGYMTRSPESPQAQESLTRALAFFRLHLAAP